VDLGRMTLGVLTSVQPLDAGYRAALAEVRALLAYRDIQKIDWSLDHEAARLPSGPADDFAEVLFELRGERTKALFRHLWEHPKTNRRDVEAAVYGETTVEPASVDRLVDRLGERLVELKGWTIERSGDFIRLHR